MHRPSFNRSESGYTLLELLVASALAALLLTSISGIAGHAMNSRALVEERVNLQREARFAMQKISAAIAESDRLILPLADAGKTSWRENVREQTNPASPPEPGSTRATAVLAVTVSAELDLDGDGFPDADNDKDGDIDEDVGSDMNNDLYPGLFGIDDDGDGKIDESNREDDDEDEDTRGTKDEDPLNGIDDDNDNNIDEDFSSDMNGDLRPGMAGEDDDGDGAIDESTTEDDDEDEDNLGDKDEDWWDTLSFFLSGTTLIQRQPVPWDENVDGKIDGLDFIESPLADNVTRLRFERLPRTFGGEQLVSIAIDISGSSGEVVTMETQIRLGAAR